MEVLLDLMVFASAIFMIAGWLAYGFVIFLSCLSEHTPRDTNSLAHELPKLAIRDPSSVWMDEAPKN